jgi:hypothetical protein
VNPGGGEGDKMAKSLCLTVVAVRKHLFRAGWMGFAALRGII